MLSFKFAAVEEASEVLVKRDSYLEELSSYECGLKMKTTDPVQEKDFLDFLQSCVLQWDEKEIIRINSILEKAKKILSLHVDFAEPILLIKTDGREEWNSAYTRENAIILPEKRISRYKDNKLMKLIIHEVFHVISKTYPSLKNILYGTIGFEKISKFELPGELKSIRLTNPDAPDIYYYTSVYYKKNLIPVIPITVLKAERDNIDSQKDILKSISTKMLVLEQDNGKFKASCSSKGPLLIDLNEINGLKDKMGTDINNFQHPEETLANIFTDISTGDNDRVPGKVLKAFNRFLIKK